MTATGQPQYHQGFEPLVAGFSYAPFGDLAAVGRLIDDQTCAILVEPVQGEGGRQLTPRQAIWKACDSLPISTSCSSCSMKCKLVWAARVNGLPSRTGMFSPI